MTTEIAVLNRLGVALAADSAVTITGAGTTKVFNSADKLFELSCVLPVAVMLNGNMDCFGVPWEIIVKDFREERGTKHKSILEWAEELVEFVDSRADIGKDAETKYVSLVTLSELEVIQGEVQRRWFGQSSKGISFQTLGQEAITARRAELKGKQIAESLQNISSQALAEEYSDLIIAVAKEHPFLLHVAPELENDFVLLVADAIRAVIPNDLSTGLIIAGYGDGDNYPSVATVDIDGYVKERLKYSHINDRAKINSPELGYAVSFAQTDVIERLLGGADPRFVKKTSEFLALSAEKLAPVIVDAYAPKARKLRKQKEIAKIKEILDIVNESYADAATSFRIEFREEFERMIALMPKLELIELAEALISITAIERKATSDEGTVGGPIDVAFITKHEGFVWIKRKHYFQPNLNPRYFWRKYRQPERGVLT